MSGSAGYPPPGSEQPGAPTRAAWPPAPVPGTAPGMWGAAHKPGAMPLRPLGLGDIYDAAFRIIRFNPKATVGAAVLMSAASTALPVLATALLTATLDLSIDDDLGSGFADVVGLVVLVGSAVLGLLLYYVGTLLVTGMIAHVTAAAAIGRRLSLGEAWRATHGTRWRLVGLTIVTGLAWTLLLAAYVVASVGVVVASPSGLVEVLYFLVSVPTFLAFVIWAWVRLTYLTVPALTVEHIGVFGAIGRAYRLSRRQFWRTFGIALLTLIVTGIASQVLTTPLALVLQLATFAVGPAAAVFLLVLGQALTMVISAAFVTPFTSAVTAVQYLDQRIRKEAYDVELMTQAGIPTS